MEFASIRGNKIGLIARFRKISRIQGLILYLFIIKTLIVTERGNIVEANVVYCELRQT